MAEDENVIEGVTKGTEAMAQANLQTAVDIVTQLTAHTDRVKAIWKPLSAHSAPQELSLIKIPGENGGLPRYILIFNSPLGLGDGALAAEIDSGTPAKGAIDLKKIKGKSPHEVTLSDLSGDGVEIVPHYVTRSGLAGNEAVVRVRARELELATKRGSGV